MINPFDESDSFEPFIFQCFVGSFCDRDGTVFSYGSQPWLDIIFAQQLGKDLAGKDMGLIRDDMFWWAILFDGTFQNIVDPACIGAFQWNRSVDFTGEVVNDPTDMDGHRPQQNTIVVSMDQT